MSGYRFRAAAALVCLSMPVILMIGSGTADGLLGGPCTYDEYIGECRICSIIETNESADQENTTGGPGYAGFEVRFQFSPLQQLPKAVTDSATQFLNGCKNLLSLYNGWYPGPMFLKKYNVSEGKEFNCSMNVERSGTCTPVIIEFKEIDRRDYFESSA